MLIAAEAVWQDGRLVPGLGLRLEAGLVAALGPFDGTPDLRLRLLLPAPLDLQVNGGGGVLFNAAPTPEGIAAIVAAHRGRGTGAILPTLLSDAPEVAEAAAAAVRAAWGLPGLAGLHLEGPHLAPARRGTHAAGHLRPLDDRTVGLVAGLRAEGIPVMVTLAPERADPERLAALARTGAVISAGHSAATAAEARAGFAAGIGCVTHLWNAMDPMLSRAPGLAAAALLSDAFVGLIADGIHVAPEMLALAVRAKPEGLFLVSDAMPSVGGPPGFDLYGGRITLAEGVLRNAEGALAGAHLDMAGALRNLHRLAGVDLATCVRMATDTPRRVLGLPPVRIAAGLPAGALLGLDAGLRRVALQAGGVPD